MFIKYIRVLLDPDAKPESGSSTESEGQAAEPKSIAEAAQQAFDESSSHEEPEEGIVPEENNTPETPEGEQTPEENEEAKPEEEVEPEKPEESDEDPEDKPKGEDVPFHNHPRFKEVMKERDDARVEAAKVKEYEPMAEAWAQHSAFIRDNEIAGEDVALMMNFLAQRQTDPVKAREMLKPLWESLAPYDPGVLPADLQEAVKTGAISADLAKEMASHRARTKGFERTQQMTVKQQQKQTQQGIVNALVGWDNTQRKSDPTFKPKTNGEADGLYELTAAKYSYLQQMRPPRNADEALALVKRALEESKQFVAKFNGKKAATLKTPRSGDSSIKTRTEPKSIRDVVRQTAEGAGIRTSL